MIPLLGFWLRWATAGNQSSDESRDDAEIVTDGPDDAPDRLVLRRRVGSDDEPGLEARGVGEFAVDEATVEDLEEWR